MDNNVKEIIITIRGRELSDMRIKTKTKSGDDATKGDRIEVLKEAIKILESK